MLFAQQIFVKVPSQCLQSPGYLFLTSAQNPTLRFSTLPGNSEASSMLVV